MFGRTKKQHHVSTLHFLPEGKQTQTNNLSTVVEQNGAVSPENIVFMIGPKLPPKVGTGALVEKSEQNPTNLR